MWIIAFLAGALALSGCGESPTAPKELLWTRVSDAYSSHVWGTAGDDVFVVAWNGIRHFDGAAWTHMLVGSQTTGLWGSSGKDVLAVRTYDYPYLHYDGSRWEEVGSNGYYLQAIWGAEPNEVFAVGGEGEERPYPECPFDCTREVIYRFDGTQWQPMLWGTARPLNGVWGSTAEDVYAVGSEGTILHYDGLSWQPMSSGTTETLLDVWGTSSRNVFAVGTNGLVLHYDGAAWNPMPTGTTELLRGVWGSTATDVFAVGSHGVVLRFDGRRWSQVHIGTEGHLRDVWGAASGDIYIVGVDGVYQSVLR